MNPNRMILETFADSLEKKGYKEQAQRIKEEVVKIYGQADAKVEEGKKA